MDMRRYAVIALDRASAEDTPNPNPRILARDLIYLDACSVADEIRNRDQIDCEVWLDGVQDQVSLPTLPTIDRLCRILPQSSKHLLLLISDIGEKKIQVIKEVRTLTTLGLKEAKELVESAPAILGSFPENEVHAAATTLEQSGATVEILGDSTVVDAELYSVIILTPPTSTQPHISPILRDASATPPGEVLAVSMSKYFAEGAVLMISEAGGTAEIVKNAA